MMSRRRAKIEDNQGKEKVVAKPKGNGNDAEDEEISLTSWLDLYQGFVESTADLLKDEISNIKTRKITKNMKVLQNERKPEAVRLSKNIVTGFNDAISKAVKELQRVGAEMSDELQKRYNLPEDWMLSSSSNVSLVGSDLYGPAFRKKKELELSRLGLLLNDTNGSTDGSDKGTEKDDSNHTNSTALSIDKSKSTENEGDSSDDTIIPEAASLNQQNEKIDGGSTKNTPKKSTNEKSPPSTPKQSDIVENGEVEDDVNMIPGSEDENLMNGDDDTLASDSASPSPIKTRRNLRIKQEKTPKKSTNDSANKGASSSKSKGTPNSTTKFNSAFSDSSGAESDGSATTCIVPTKKKQPTQPVIKPVLDPVKIKKERNTEGPEPNKQIAEQSTIVVEDKSESTPTKKSVQESEANPNEKSGKKSEATPNEKSAKKSEATPNEKSGKKLEATPNEKSAKKSEATPNDKSGKKSEATPNDKSGKKSESMAEKKAVKNLIKIKKEPEDKETQRQEKDNTDFANNTGEGDDINSSSPMNEDHSVPESGGDDFMNFLSPPPSSPVSPPPPHEIDDDDMYDAMTVVVERKPKAKEIKKESQLAVTPKKKADKEDDKGKAHDKDKDDANDTIEINESDIPEEAPEKNEIAKKKSNRKSKEELQAMKDVLGSSSSDADTPKKKRRDKNDATKPKKNDTKASSSKKSKEESKAMQVLLDSSDSESEVGKKVPEGKSSNKNGDSGTAEKKDDDDTATTSQKVKTKPVWKDDPKLNSEVMVTQVMLEKLSPGVEKSLRDDGYVTLKGYSKLKRRSLNQLLNGNESSSDTDSSLASNDSLQALRKELDKLTRSSIISTIKHKRKSDTGKSEKKFRKKKRAGKRNQNDELETGSSSSSNEERRSTLKPGPKVFDSDILSCTESDLDPESDDGTRKDKKSTRASTSSKKPDPDVKRKRYLQATLSSSGSEKEHMKAVLGSDSDSEKKKRTRVKKEKSSSGSDSDFIAVKTKVSKKSRRHDSDSSLMSIKSGDSDSDSDSDFKKKRTQRSSKRRRDRDSSPENKKKKKKRRRVVTHDSDDDDSKKADDSDIEEVPQDEEGNSQKGRKKIRKILSTKELAKTTKEAEREEEARRQRLADKQNLFNGIHKAVESDKLERLVLDIDPETKEPVVEVDQSIVKKLKPHQAEGIKFMYNACFESIDMIKKKKEPGGCILAHCMGLGKTLQSIAFVHTLLTNEVCGIKTVLVICPLSTVNNWYMEFRNWTEDADSQLKIHKLFEAKSSAASRTDYLKTWARRGGVGLLHYDMFRRLADPKGTAKGIKPSLRNVIKETLLDPGPDLVICDEGHLLKNCKSILSLAVNNIRTHRRVVLTGTPLQNNLVEYHTMMNFVKPNLLGTMTEFTNRFVNPIKNGQHADSTDYDVKIMKRRAHVLHRKLEGCVQRCDYSILAPYLPPKYEYIINIKLSDKQEALYKQYLNTVVDQDPLARRRHLLKYYAELVKVWSHPIALTMRRTNKVDDEASSDEGSLKDFICDDESTTEGDSGGEGTSSKSKRKTRAQAANDPEGEKPATLEDALLAGGWWNSILPKSEMEDVTLSGKLVILQEILKTSEAIGDRVLVFSQFLTSLDIIEEFLDNWDKEAVRQEREEEPITFPLTSGPKAGRWRRNLEYFRIDGQTKVEDRHRDCEKFNKKSSLSKAKLFLISTRAGGLGINLYGANRVVIFDASWNPSQDMQSIFRVYRFGQVKPCYIYRLIARGTMEEKILRRQITKLSLSSRVVDEHQIERHFKFDDVNEMYMYDDEDPSTKDAVLAVPKDRLLADLLMSHREWIRSYEEFDSLLENKPDEGLTNDEKELAWEEYRIESERQRQSHINSTSSATNEAETYLKVKSRLITNHPGASPEQIEQATRLSILVIERIRNLILIQNKYPQQQHGLVDTYLNPLKTWLQKAVSPQTPVVNVVIPEQPILDPVPQCFYDPFPPQQVQQFQFPQFQYQQAPRPPIIRRGPVPGILPQVTPQALQHVANNMRHIASGQLQQGVPRAGLLRRDPYT